MLLFFLAACEAVSDTADTDTAEVAEAPAVDWLAPAEGADVLPEVDCSLVVTDFTFVDLAKHGEGEASGFLRVRVDDVDAGDFDSTTFTLSALATGAHTLSAQLYYEDGDAVQVADGLLCDEDAEGCAPVTASVAVTVVVTAGG